jgi:predicted TIM-barrel fold metal-dependent hydrolase
MTVDVHQHFWTEPLLRALSERDQLPFVRREAGSTVLYSDAEHPYMIASESAADRLRALDRDGVDVAVVAISSPIGIEALPRDDATSLIEAHLAGVEQLPDRFRAWGPVALTAADPGDVDAVLDRGCVGISLPAHALSSPAALASAGPLLDRAGTFGAPVFVHPGGPPPSDGSRRSLNGPPHADGSPALLGGPAWWRPLTDYVAQMQAAWLTFATLGRREHPDVTIVFAMLAGGAPLLTERLETRGGPPVELRDPLTFYDTSSYGPFAVEAMARRVGAEQLVYGSDRPVLEPLLTGREPLLLQTAARLIKPAPTATA